MIKKISIILILGIFLISFVSALCTVTLDKTSYIAGETATAAMSCSAATEKNDGYRLNWTFQNGTSVELDTGTTPSTIGENFYQTYNIPSSWPNGVWINATLLGNGNDDLEGTDSANVSSIGGSGSLKITNTTFAGGYLGLVSSITAAVTDETGKKITGGLCKISTWSNDESRMLMSKETAMFNGIVEVGEIMPTTRFNEGIDYAYKITCYCGSDASGTECIDEDGSPIADSLGTAKNFFTTNTWITVNTVTDKSIYEFKDEIFVCANVTNVNYTKRIPLYIYYQIRCSKEKDNNQDTDRILIDFNLKDLPDTRGISANTTQMQCMKFTIPEEKYLMGRNSECYASTEVWVLDNSNEELIGYSTTSSLFNISSNEINLEADWQWISDTKINSIVNLSEFNNINGSGTGDIDIRMNFNQEFNIKNIFEMANSLSNISIKNSTSYLSSHTDYELEFLEDGYVELELRNVDLNSGWWNITIDFYDLGLREVEALEGIENRTGTFHLDVECPLTGIIGEGMTCDITAYIEDSQLVEKEVDFTCYITDGSNQFSSTNFNQMITRNALTISKTFSVPSTFSNGAQYIVQCHADYYNLGSRRDSFYDTFTARTDRGRAGGTSSSPEGETPITGGAIDEETPDKEPGDIIDKINPFSPKRSWVFIFIELIILIGLILIILRYINKKEKHYFSCNKETWKKRIKKISLILLGVLILIGLILGAVYGYKASKENTAENQISSSLLQDPLFRGMILTGFIVLMIIILFKALNLRGELKFGEDYSIRKYYEDKKSEKLQQKLNHLALKQEIKKQESNKNYKIKKMTLAELKERIEKRKKN